MKKLVLIDGHHLMFRAFYGIQNLNRVDGVASNAIFGFLSMLLNIINQEQPTALAVAFDVGKSFRHQEDETYKSQRKEMDENLRVQIPEIQKMVKIAGLPVFTKEGFEADDVLGTLAKKAAKQGYQVCIISGDRDLWQLIDDQIEVAIPGNPQKPGQHFDATSVYTELGIKPEQVPDYKGLRGDTADNIKGVPGIGPKKAQILIQTYQSIENLYQNLDNLKELEKNLLLKYQKEAFYSKYLATIVQNVDLDFNWEDLNFQGFNPELAEFCQDWQLKTLLPRLQKHLKMGKKTEKTYEAQLSLFGD